nr:ATP synthase F0 subunit 8 [Pholidoptera griseoaptera]
MPQMMPMNWLFLFLMFSAALIMFAAMNYYIFHYNIPSPTNTTSLKTNSLIWKW